MPIKGYAKINIANDKQMADFILGMFKSLAKNSKTQISVVYTEKGFEWSVIKGENGNQKFVLTPMYEKTPNSVNTKYNLKVGDYEVEFDQSYNSRDIAYKYCDVVRFLHERIKRDYFFDENSHEYYPRPQQPNMFQRFIQRLRGE